MLPNLSSNAQKAAQMAGATPKGVATRSLSSDSRPMVCGHTRACTCNSIFRYPSPYGWSDSVPVGSPIFCFHSNVYGQTRQALAESGPSLQKSFSPEFKRAICAPEADNFWRGRKTCANSRQHFFVQVPSRRWSPVAKPRANRRSSARVQARQLPLFLAAAFLPARLSGGQATSFTAKKTPANVTNPNFSAATLRSETHTRAIGATTAPVALFVSTARGLPAGQEPEGT
ncbi:hypothetical protein SAMN05444000_1179 [Shimia gijangensis]|uniref:Uncharacterized protein n=1 Tax=Shimia gijangensis TaxID=1470563 RepID=A0A1M6NYS8_9RHOB|nr:hypothetical protein SAMN05444000_1179 [Shimia gijangensis]